MSNGQKTGKRVVLMGGLPDSLIVFRQDLLKKMVAAGHEVIACASLQDPLTGKSVQDPVKAVEALGVRYVDIPLDRTTVDPKGDIKSLFAIKKILKDLKPDVLITYSQKPIIYGSIAAKMAKIKRIHPMVTGLGFGLRDYEQGTRTAKIVRFLFKTAFKGCGTAIYQNNDDMSLFRKLGILRPDQKSVIVNGSGVNVDHYTPAEFPSGPITFLLIGRLLKGKGVFEYVEAAEILKKKGYQARVLLAGPLDEHPHALTKAQIDEMSKSGVIEYLGSLKDVRPSLAACHVYVLPSYHEGTPRTVLEAMAMGRPIITTDAPGCRETIVHNENGFLVPVREAAPLADAMERFLKEPELLVPFGIRSREIAVNKYDVNIVSRQVMDAVGL